ncbi:MAG TPA: winged helix-turn-helix domain-containing protein [Streptosporangiaceae bacterium]|nr:winged helix-turn-helix domain-containing protein [Streptosporangiaceae bacterium]
MAVPASPPHPRSARVRRHRPAHLADPSPAMPDDRDVSPGPQVLRCGDLVLDESRWTVHRAGTLVDLSPTEFRLLACLLRHQGSVLSRAQLLEHVWGRGYTGQSQVVETYVSYLRRKLHRLGPSLIHTRRGAGYLLCAPETGTPGTGAPDLADG